MSTPYKDWSPSHVREAAEHIRLRERSLAAAMYALAFLNQCASLR